MRKIKLNDVEYDISNENERVKNLIAELQNVELRLKEQINMVSILTKAKNSYIADLKREMLTSKAGLDFLE